MLGRQSSSNPTRHFIFGLVVFHSLLLVNSPQAMETDQSNRTLHLLKNESAASTGSSSPVYLRPNQSNVAQHGSASGGGEGKPEDWGSPKRFDYLPAPYLDARLVWFRILQTSYFHLLAWWF
jgi:hypothetical protein